MRRAIIQLDHARKHGTHPGLLLERYLTKQTHLDAPQTVRAEYVRERRTLFDAALSAARSESLSAIYLAAFSRWTQSFPQNTGQQAAELTTTSRLVVGLGSENVLEAGLRLHHTYGVPIIPGSALKGLASHYCHDVWGQRHNENASEENQLFRRGEAHHSLLFGTTEDGGVITFHDAWVTPASLRDGSLRLDVMTPHHPKWQANEAPPTDFDSPVPVLFLSVAGTFDVRLSWSGPATTPADQAGAWTALAMHLLQEALAEWGVGGKTSSGYGRLVPPASLRNRPSHSLVTQPEQVSLPKAGARVEAQLLDERTKKGGWKAMHTQSGLGGHILNSGDVPSDNKAGDTIELIVHSSNEREITFRYPTPADKERVQRVSSHGKSGRIVPGRGGRRR